MSRLVYFWHNECSRKLHFSETYRTSQDESYMNWMFVFHRVTHENRVKPFLPPPYAVLFLFVGVIYLIVWLIVLPIRLCKERKAKIEDKAINSSSTKKKSKEEEAIGMNHYKSKTDKGGLLDDTDEDATEAAESKSLNFYEGMEVFMKSKSYNSK